MLSKTFTRLTALLLALTLCLGLAAAAFAAETEGLTYYTGTLSHGVPGKNTAEYTGGEMRLPYKIRSMENLLDSGIGLGLLVDGIPQPYKLTEDGEEAYFHTIDMKGEKYADLELIFTPVTGKKGDKQEVAVYSVVAPEYFEGDPMVGPFDGSDMMFSFLQLTFQADAPQQELPKLEPGKVSTETGKNPELTALQVDGMKSREVTGQETIQWNLASTPGKDYRLVVYIDHKPVSVTDIPTTKEGELVHFELTLPELEAGEHTCYTVAFDRTWRLNGGNPDTTASETVYLNVK